MFIRFLRFGILYALFVERDKLPILVLFEGADTDVTVNASCYDIPTSYDAAIRSAYTRFGKRFTQAFRGDHLHHLVGGGFGGVLLEETRHGKDRVALPYLGHAIGIAAGGLVGLPGRIDHRRSFRLCQTSS